MDCLWSCAGKFWLRLLGNVFVILCADGDLIDGSYTTETIEY